MSDDNIDIRLIRKDINDINVTIARVEEKLDQVEKTIKEVKIELREDFVKAEAFTPVRNFVYGTVAVIATGFITAILFLISWGR